MQDSRRVYNREVYMQKNRKSLHPEKVEMFEVEKFTCRKVEKFTVEQFTCRKVERFTCRTVGMFTIEKFTCRKIEKVYIRKKYKCLHAGRQKNLYIHKKSKKLK